MAKEQHYVPQMILRNWSEDDASINLYLLDDDRIINNVAINKQAKEHYYYGADQKIENLYNTLETETSTVFSKLKNRDFNLSFTDRRSIYHFIATQKCRTPGALGLLDDNITVMGKNILKLSKKFEEKDIDNLQIHLNNGPIWQLWMYLITIPTLLDLKFIVLQAKDGNHFIINQSPVLCLNPYLYEKKWPEGKNGLLLKGVLVIIPISPELALCLYDKSTYGIVHQGSSVLLEDEDIDLINKYQFCETNNCVYFDIWNEKYRGFNYESKDYRVQEKAIIQNYVNIQNKNDILSVTSSLEYPFPPYFSFLRIKEIAYKTILNKQNLIRFSALEAVKNAEDYYKSFQGMEKIFNGVKYV